MKTVTIKAFVYELDWGSGDKQYVPFTSDDMGDKWHTLVGPVEINYTIPDGYNHTAQKLAALEAEKAKVREAYQAKVAEINERIGKLQAIAFDGTVS